jgi:hypothetical protein
MHPLITTATKAELEFIASFDYGQDKEQHYQALIELIFTRQGKFQEGNSWFPCEVIEICAMYVQEGHEREFCISCLLLLHAMESGFDQWTCEESQRARVKEQLGKLPEELSNILAQAYASNH